MLWEIFVEFIVQICKLKIDLQQIIKYFGCSSLLLFKFNDSLFSINWMNSYFCQGCNGWFFELVKVLVKIVECDVCLLDEYLVKMFIEINFFFDVIFGLINIEQNSIIKVFFIVVVLFLLLILVGIVYGMNFKDMFELDWFIGYLMVLGMMVVLVIFLYFWFKFKNWF